MSDETKTLRYDRVINYTDKAVLFAFDDDEQWIPSSQIHNFDDLDFTGETDGEVVVAGWFVDKEDLDEYEVL